MIDDGRFGRPVAMEHVEELMGRCLLATEGRKAKHLLSESSRREIRRPSCTACGRSTQRFYAALRVPIFVDARQRRSKKIIR